tara:strand:- start:270829 stop:271173 length:345 start_codon:yes stop_codon:yes gene_type:complete
MLEPVTISIIVFVLACFIGYHVIWGVTPALHTPLMAVTNAISGIVIVGAILVTGMAEVHPGIPLLHQPGFYAHVAGFVGVVLASINIFGGFVVTRRMLAMFRRKDNKNTKQGAK